MHRTCFLSENRSAIYNIKRRSNDIMVFQILAIWGCMPELTKDCLDMTNASSTYLSIAIGVVVGTLISWWIYHAQKKTSEKQDEVQRRIKELGEIHEKILESIEGFQKHHEKVLNEILSLDKKIDSIIEKKVDS
jgi:SNF family Na+-dependent transporter